MNQQGIFDKVATHLIAQGKQSLADELYGHVGICAYRGYDGTMCAAGCLIPDDEYKPEFENKTWTFIARKIPSFSNAPDEIHDLIGSLQSAHDFKSSWKSPETLKKALGAVAKRHGLSADVLN